MGVTQHEPSKYERRQVHSFTHPASTAQDITESLATFLSILPRNRDKRLHKESDAGKHNQISERMIK